jgi:hypothetical protein
MLNTHVKKLELRQLIREELLKEVDKSSKYIESLEDLRKAIKNEVGEFREDTISKIYYVNAIKYGIREKIISDLVRKRINRYNRKNFKLSGPKTKDTILGGIDLILKNLKTE